MTDRAVPLQVNRAQAVDGLAVSVSSSVAPSIRFSQSTTWLGPPGPGDPFQTRYQETPCICARKASTARLKTSASRSRVVVSPVG